MRGLYFKLSLWSLGTLGFCVLAILLTAGALNRNFAQRGGPLGKSIQWQAEQAEKAFERGGREGLSSYMTGFSQYIPERRYIVDRAGRDVLNGEDRSALVKVATEPRITPPLSGSSFWLIRPTASGKFQLLVELDAAVSTSGTLPYLAAILAAIALLSYALFRYLVSPLRTLSQAVRRFGQGDFSARAIVRRGDEFGEAAEAFNVMASRIETLLNAERRLLEDVSHELRSPLARMQFALELVRTSPDREAGVQKLRREIERLSELVGQLLEVTRAEGDPRARSHGPVDLSALSRELVESCSIEAEAKGCLITHTQSPPITIKADHELIHRAMENLIRNAIRHAPEDSSIEVQLVAKNSMAEFVVRDRGPGVPPAMLNQIFEPFFRVDPSRTEGSGGVGLGLSIVKRAVELHRGIVKASNANPGLRVQISLPLAS